MPAKIISVPIGGTHKAKNMLPKGMPYSLDVVLTKLRHTLPFRNLLLTVQMQPY